MLPAFHLYLTIDLTIFPSGKANQLEKLLII